MARAKQTGRAEARRKYRQATTLDPDAELESPPDEPGTEGELAKPARGSQGAARGSQPAARDQAPARPGFGYAFRAAYHPANVREDLKVLPQLVRHWSFLATIALMIVSAVVATIWWNYSGGRALYQLVLLPGTGFGLPQLVVGFFAPRASYLMGFLVSIVQGVVAIAFAFNLSASLGTPITGDQLPGMLVPAFLAGPLSGMLFAAAAAWYRRFLSLTSPRRAAAARQRQARSSTRGNGSRRPAGR